MIDNRREYILCAAIKHAKGVKFSAFENKKPYHDPHNDIVDCELGYRHHDILQKFLGIVSKKPGDQGFFTSKNRFVGRAEAMKIAYECGQVNKDKAFRKTEYDIEDVKDLKYSKIYNDLYSEDLYEFI